MTRLLRIPLTAVLVAAVVGLLGLSSPALTASIACIRYASAVGHTTHFFWYGDGRPTCHVEIGGHLVVVR